MKHFFQQLLNYVSSQIQITLSVIFYSKKQLFRIAMSHQHHPLLILTKRKEKRVWWLCTAGIIIWLLVFIPRINLTFFADATTFFSQIRNTTEIMYFNKWIINKHIVLLFGAPLGALLVLMEVYSLYKINYFRRNIR